MEIYINIEQKEKQMFAFDAVYNHSVNSLTLMDALGCSKSELERWIKLDRIKILKTKNSVNNKNVNYFDPKYMRFTNDEIMNWRLEDKKNGLIKRLIGNKKRNEILQRIGIKSFGNPELFFRYDIVLKFSLATKKGICFKILSKIELSDSYLKKNIINFLTDKIKSVEKYAEEHNFEQMQKIIFYLFNEFKQNIYKNFLDLKSFKSKINTSIENIKNEIFKILNPDIYKNKNITENQKKYDDLNKKDLETENEVGFKDYPSLFKVARKLKREFIFHAGPTNSGKTYGAMMELMNAQSGLYLSPLRLMAMEAYDKIKKHGLPANMKTGEEQILEPLAKHTASTIEMMSTMEVVDVAIIDEVQIITDKDRGWAWTQAIVGCPAKKIIMTGSPEVENYLKKLVESLGDTFTSKHFNRLNPLSILSHKIGVNELNKGDAIIAFSRRRVLELHDMLNREGINVSCIYGSLSPEMRRKESHRFATGESSILIATDAIGMGLNLPIKRVLFSSITKFNGKIHTQLNDNEIRQIAGRAGRYGLHEKGSVGIFIDSNDVFSPKEHELKIIKEAINQNIFLNQYHLKVYPVMPTQEMVSYVSETYKENLPDSIKTCSRIINKNLNSFYRYNTTSSQMEIANIIEENTPYLSIETQYTYMGCPVKLNNFDIISVFKEWLQRHSDGISNDLPYDIISKENGLEYAENISAISTMYMWLSMRFKDIYTENIKAKNIHNQSDDIIEWFIKDKLLNIRKKKENNRIKQMNFQNELEQIHTKNQFEISDIINNYLNEYKKLLTPILTSWIVKKKPDLKEYFNMRKDYIHKVKDIKTIDDIVLNFCKNISYPDFKKISNFDHKKIQKLYNIFVSQIH